MIAPLPTDPPVRRISVAHEARARRWTVAGDAGRMDLGEAAIVTPGEADGGPLVAAGQRLRVALMAGPDRQLEQAARRGLLAAAAETVLVLRSDEELSFGERASALREAKADVALVLAGDGKHADGVVLLCEAFRYACAEQHPRPRVVVSGEPRAALRLHHVLSHFATEIVSDPRRDDGLAALVGHVRQLRRGADASIVLRDEALESLARAIARDAGVPAAVIDVSGSSTSLVRAEPAGAIVAAHLVPLGSGRAADRVVARAGLDRVRRWIPWAVDAPSLLERVFNRARWPDAVPAEPLALALEIALSHEAIAHALADAAATGIPAMRFRSASVIVLTGRVAELPRASQTLLVAANALQPTEVTTVARDRDDALVALGGIAARIAAADGDGSVAIARSAEAHRALLGVIVPVVAGRRTTLRVTLGATYTEQIARGAFFTLAASGAVQVSVSGGVSGRGIAGPLGILVDARGTPLALPPRDAERVPAVARWFAAVDAMSAAA